MSLQVKAYENGDHVAIVWFPSDSETIDNCRGFTVQKTCNGSETYLHGFVGFSQNATFPADDPWKWPVQRYLWWDYGVKPGDEVQYKVIPVVGTADDLKLANDSASPLTPSMKVTGQCTPHISVFFNKGIVAAQWVSRVLDQEAAGQNRQAALKQLIDKPGDPLRDSLSGLLRLEILKQLQQAKGGQLFAALYELNDPELMETLVAMGSSAQVILANGAFNSKEPDENARARETLRQAGVQVFDRMVSSGHFAHNKFAVFCDASGNAQKVLTGSTNWTETGLCTQANNALFIDDAAVADRFLQQWNLLKEAGNSFPASLVQANSKLQQFKVDDVQVTPWFAPTTKQQELEYARDLINNAKDGILFLFFNPGTYQEDPEKQTLLQCVLDRHNSSLPKNYDPSLYIRGVVNQEIANLTNQNESSSGKASTKSRLRNEPVALYNGGKEDPKVLSKDVLVPAAIKTRFQSWEDEALRASMVMVHSKVIVIDPFGDHPVLITGSHNLGVKASSKNDDNLVILEGPGSAPLAIAHAVSIIAIYQTYRWNTYVTKDGQSSSKPIWHGLEDNASWQSGYLSGDHMRELQFWMAQAQAAHPAAAAAKPVRKAAPAKRRNAAGSATA